MAERRRRDGGAEDDPRGEARDDAFEADDALDSDVTDDDLDDEFDGDDDELVDGDDDDASGRAAGGGTATKARPRSTAPAGRKSTKPISRLNIFARLVNFIREVVAELRKVIWPTRKELITYTSVVVVFVLIMLTIVGLLDYGFAKAVLWVFGSKEAPEEAQ